MGRKRIRDIRYEELIEATIVAAHKHGYNTVTMAEIAKVAGTSAASISYYFGSKDRLMAATMRHLLEKLKKSLVSRFEHANSPRERLLAVVEANFDDSLFSVPQCSMWMQFWASAPYSPQLSRLHRINRSRVRSHFRAELHQLMSPGDAEVARQALQCYMDGVWLQAAQAETPVDGAQARAAARKVTELILKNTPAS